MIAIHVSEEFGRSIIALDNIPKNTRLCVTTKVDVIKSNMTDHALSEPFDSNVEIPPYWIVPRAFDITDPMKSGHAYYLANHSSKSNCIFELVRDDNLYVSGLCLLAKRNIHPGEHITTTYKELEKGYLKQFKNPEPIDTTDVHGRWRIYAGQG